MGRHGIQEYPSGNVHIGRTRSRRIAIWFDKEEAIDLAHLYGSSDLAYDEIMAAVESAYPKLDDGTE